MAVYPADMVIYRGRFGTEEMYAVWDEKNLLQKRLDVEAAVAKAELKLGLIPEWAANEIVSKCDVKYITPEIAAGFKHGSDIVRMIKGCEKVMGEAAELLHFGLTSQDIIETSLALILKDTWKIIMRDMRALEDVLLEMADKYKTAVMPGRPHGQYGTVITFGFKAAIWAAEVRRNIERLQECRKRLFVGNLTGSHGTLAPIVHKGGPGMGIRVQGEALQMLGLKPNVICTHATRDRLAEFVNLLAMIGINLERICKTIFDLHRPEIFELEGPFVEGQQIDSSTMPHRRGPSGTDWIEGFVKILRGNALIGMDVVVQDERDAARLPFEHASLPESCMLTHNSIVSLVNYLKKMKVHIENMERNVSEEIHRKGQFRGQGGPFIQGECMLYTVAEKTGKKQSAHRMVYRIAQQAFHDQKGFKEALMADEELMSYVTEAEIDAALNPHNYIGDAPLLVDQVVNAAHEARKVEDKVLEKEGLLL
ncbi:MAG: lyase family protein [Peptococcaceae bacterium]